MTKSAGRFQATGLVLSLVLISGLSSVVGYWAGTRSVTPLEAALSAQPPDAEPVLVPVERGQLVDRFTLPGTVLPWSCLLYTSPSPRDGLLSRMPSSA